MNKYLKYFSGTLVGLMLSTSAFAAAEYAVVLKTLSNPFWVDMKKGIEDEAKTLGVSVDIFASPSEGDFQSQLQLFEDLSNKNYKGIAFAPLSSVNLVMPVARAWKKGIYLVNLDEKIDMDNLKKAGGNVEAFVTTDNVAVGAKGASFIIDKLGAEGGEVAIIEGKAGNASGEARRNGATEAFKKAPKLPVVILLDHVRSQNNVGSVFRTSDAFRIEKIFLCGITSTPENREVHKTALGAEDAVDWEYVKDTTEAVDRLKKEGYRIFAIEQAENTTSRINSSVCR